MSSLDAQDTGDRVSIWSDILQSSLILAVLTGLLYFMGGAYYEGYSQTLGLRYLAGLQPAEYMFAGAKLLMNSSLLLVVVMIVVALPAAPAIQTLLTIKPRYFPRRWESLIMVLIFPLFVLSLCLSPTPPRDLIENVCPINPNGSRPQLQGSLAIIFLTFLSQFFSSRRLRLTFLAWGLFIVSFSLYIYARTQGANQLYESFQLAKIASLSLSATAETNVLILGSDDKNLVVLVPGENSTGHPEPRYLLRSEIRTFRIIRNSTINEFFCSQIPGR